MEIASTTLILLVREGRMTVTFTPALDDGTYAQLLSIVERCYEGPSLKAELERAAVEWDRDMSFGA